MKEITSIKSLYNLRKDIIKSHSMNEFINIKSDLTSDLKYFSIYYCDGYFIRQINYAPFNS
jgi:hypothetical protein